MTMRGLHSRATIVETQAPRGRTWKPCDRIGENAPGHLADPILAYQELLVMEAFSSASLKQPEEFR